MKKIVEEKNANQKLLNSNIPAQKVYAGNFYSINTIRAKGHKGELRNVKKNGTAKAVIVTHSEFTRGRKNLELNL